MTLAEKLAQAVLRGFFGDEHGFERMDLPTRKRAVDAAHEALSEFRVAVEEFAKGETQSHRIPGKFNKESTPMTWCRLCSRWVGALQVHESKCPMIGIF